MHNDCRDNNNDIYCKDNILNNYNPCNNMNDNHFSVICKPGPQGPQGPQGEIGLTGPQGPSYASTGFSAFIPSLNISSSTQLTNWSVTSPYYSDPNFNTTTGYFTVPETGRYSIKATINYSTTAAISGSIGTYNPSFVVRKTSPNTENLVSGLFPLLNISVVVLTLRAILGSGTVVLAGDVELTAGDVVGLFYIADGMNLSLNLGGSDTGGVVWSIHRIS